jgi:hypothetical protein
MPKVLALHHACAEQLGNNKFDQQLRSPVVSFQAGWLAKLASNMWPTECLTHQPVCQTVSGCYSWSRVNTV